MVKFTLASLILFVSINSFAINRINPSINKIEQLITSFKNTSNPADRVSRSAVRVFAFNTQSIARLYKGEEDEIKKVYKDYKKLEDLIGDITKWRGLVSFAENRNASRSKILELQKKLKESEKNLQKFLLDGWLDGSIYKVHLEKLAFLDDLSDEQERALTLELILKSLKKFEATNFDFGILEHGNGLHEFRRELRWQLYQIVNLGGLIDYKTNRLSCPLNEFDQRSLSRGNKYTEINKIFNENSCLIDYCLMSEIANVVTKIGDIKDEVEGLLNTRGNNDDVTPPLYLQEALKIQRKWEQSGVLKMLINQITSCL